MDCSDKIFLCPSLAPNPEEKKNYQVNVTKLNVDFLLQLVSVGDLPRV